jgi:hypothetical protein
LGASSGIIKKKGLTKQESAFIYFRDFFVQRLVRLLVDQTAE